MLLRVVNRVVVKMVLLQNYMKIVHSKTFCKKIEQWSYTSNPSSLKRRRIDENGAITYFSLLNSTSIEFSCR